MKRPVAYLRKSKVSSDRHVSWEVQEAEIRALAARHGDDELELLSDWGKSGRGERTRFRGEYRRLREKIAADEVSVVYAYSLSRLSRSLGEYASLAELCQAHEVRIRLAKEGEFDYTNASGRFTVGILALLAQMEAELAQERAKDTIAARRVRGDHVGSAGFGKRLDKGQLVDNPTEDLEAVLDAYRQVGSFAGAARILNARKVRSKFGRAWSGTTVGRVIRTGAPQELAGRPVVERVKQRGSYVLSRLLRCPCGQLMTGASNYTKTQYGTFGPYIRYQCHRGRFDPTHPRPYTIKESAVLPWVKAEAGRLRVPEAIVETAGDDSRRDDLMARRLRVIDNYEDGLFGKDGKPERDRKLAEIADALASLDTAERVTEVPEIDWDWAPGDLNAILRQMWSAVELGPDLMPVQAEWTVPEWRA